MILNRKDCCGERISNAQVEIDGKLCGFVPVATVVGQWYTVECEFPILG